MSQDYLPNNSHKYKESQKAAPERKKVEKVVKGNVKVRPKNGMTKFAGMIVSETPSSVGAHLFLEVFVPAIKKLISDVARDGIDMMLYGETRGRSSHSSNASYVSYRDFSRKDDDRGRDISRSRSIYSPDDIVVDSYADAEEVIARMDELIDMYGNVSVADLYDLVGKSAEYTDHRYGWTNVRNAEPIRVRDGFIIRLPKVTPLKK